MANQLPTDEGFYWWRLGPGLDWRMVQVVRFGESERHHMTYDVEFYAWHARSLANWKSLEEKKWGEWIKIQKPE